MKVLDKVVEGRLGKLLSDWCLEAQRYVLEDELTVDKLMARWVGEAKGGARQGRMPRGEAREAPQEAGGQEEGHGKEGGTG